MMSRLNLLWLCVCSGLLAPASPAPVDVTATPPRLLVGFTEHMTLTCDMRNDVTFFREVQSLVLTKTGPEESGNSTDIASMTHLQPLVVNVRDSLSAHVDGALMQDGVNITYTWSYPPSEAAGTYTCTVFGMDTLGHPVQAQGMTRVVMTEFGYDMILDKLRELELSQSALKSRLNRTETELINTNLDLNQTKIDLINTNQNLTLTTNALVDTNQKLNQTTAELEVMKQQRDQLKSAVIVASTTYNHHEYVVSKPQWEGQSLANVQCQIFGGYLAEIDDQHEFDFLITFLKANDAKTAYHTWISGTDHAAEDKWVYTHSGKPVTFFKWYPGEPNGKANENCMDISKTGYLMNDLPCRDYTVETSFLCEIPL